ncbi:hypothetical protein GQ55_2G302700 [Panicum hallii var. hallii]|uniref:Uncharacterized protein n=1 Tax=Panicum hallii var. hallii TaxID=1504633 RepID=A0A2T7ETY1_9POAL|nr:hypothetical protein GQ55_2G302700 [Panicum hallii var. hallii]
MRVTNYQRLSPAPEPEEGGVRAGAARAWAALRRGAAGVARLYAARRRWAARRLWGGRRAALPLRVKAAARYEYDSASYARNFDDGTWMAEEGVSWHARSLAAFQSFVGRGSLSSLLCEN